MNSNQNPNKQKNIFVTKPFLPPLEEFMVYLQKIWESGVVTNGALFHEQLESELSKHLGVDHISLFTNGTIALITALKALEISGEVITTPYSFVATSHALLWNGLTPVFADIDPNSLNLNPLKIEEHITENTTAIMPVHCYGRPCDVDVIAKIASNYKLKTIYDAAHAFGVRDEVGSILNYGDLSVLSFHATKTFHTFEGGAIISPDAKTKLKIDRLKNFGFVDEVTVDAIGINGKLSEINAAMGLLQLKYIDSAIANRKNIDKLYREGFKGVRGIRVMEGKSGYTPNYSYFPILVDAEYPIGRDDLYEELKDHGIYARRYFYPLISNFHMYRNLPSSSPENLPVASEVAEKILCLPIYPDLEIATVNKIINLIVRK